MKQKSVLSCALTGVLANRKQCPYLPYTPDEIALEAKRAYDQGATIAHIHARESDGSASWRVEVFQEIQERVARLCPILLNFSTGGIGNSLSERAAATLALGPTLAAVNMGSMNYGIFSHREKRFTVDEVFLNPFHEIQWLLEKLKEKGTIPELECFDSGQICNADYFVEMGLLRAPLHFSLILGVCGGMKASFSCLESQVKLLPEGSTFQVIGIGRSQWELGRWGLELGGDFRVGMEDNFYLPDGITMAKSNGELVKAGVTLMQSLGISPTTLEETKIVLGLK